MGQQDSEHRVAPAGHGLAWFQSALRVFERSPRGLVQIASTIVVLMMLPSLVAPVPILELVFSVLLYVLGPALFAGLLFAIGEAHAGRPVVLGQLFEGLRRPEVRSQLLVLGIFLLTEMVLMGLSVQRILGPGNLKVLQQIADQTIKPDSAVALAAVEPMLKALVVMLAIGLFLLTGLFFSVPRVMFDGGRGLLAIFESFWVCAANVLPLIVLGLLSIVAAFALLVALGFVAVILGLLGPIGVLLFVPVLVAALMIGILVFASANYFAWREIYGRDGGAAPPPPVGGIIV